MARVTCPSCGSDRVMATEDRSDGVCNDCGFAWTGGYPMKMAAELMRPEIAEAVISQITGLQDIVGYHFPWCPCYRNRDGLRCECGMDQLRLARAWLMEVIDGRR